MRIVVDAMGSDECPVPDVAGAVMAAQEWNDALFLVGDPQRVRQELDRHNTRGLNVEIVPAEQQILMTDKPGVVGQSKPHSSMHIGMNMVKDNLADAFVTAGNTGAAMAIATLFTLRRIQGVRRPALSSIFRVGTQNLILLDIGANADSKPEWLGQFAMMGKIYAQQALGIQNPRVALLSNGEEEGKGNQLIHEAQALLQSLELRFIGNVEPKDVFRGQADVVVADGFVGNIAVKSFEAAASLLFDLIRTEIKSDLVSTMGGLLARRAFRRVYKQVDPFEVGGAPLLGVNGVVIIGHGRSNARAVKNAIRQARLAVEGRIVEHIQAGLEKHSDIKMGAG
ncbi:MAG: phosphate acyltransferase PlsX [Chloroflexi bacterium]|nr:phosphate acyltransferase PlsX [Chloroflexota bacterium]MDL1882786.1 phosphate acyltransferase PlsX [Anaerolineae bacterium CFX8]